MPFISAPVWLLSIEKALVSPGQPMDQEFHDWLIAFAHENDVRLTTELDFSAALHLVGPGLMGTVAACYAARGNSVWVRMRQIHEMKFDFPAPLLPFLTQLASQSLYPLPHRASFTTHHGQLRMSLLGASPTPEERRRYFEWDCAFDERQGLAQEVCSAFPLLHAQPSQDHSLDIYPRAARKAQVLQGINRPVYVVGDCLNSQSEDQCLARSAVTRKDNSRVFTSTDWTTTWAVLRAVVPESTILQREAHREGSCQV